MTDDGQTRAEALAERIEALLAPIAGDDPAGPDMDYDPARETIRLNFQSDFGAVGGASGVNWREVIGQIENQLGQTKDLWLAVYLMRAGAHAGDLAAVQVGSEVLRGLLDRFWSTVHPKLEDGATSRVSACNSLADIASFIEPLERMKLLDSDRFGSFSAADFQRLAANGAAEPDIDAFRQAVEEAGSSRLAEIAGAFPAIRSALSAADFVFMDKSGAGPNLQATYAALDRIGHAVRTFVTESAPAAVVPDSAADAAAPVASTPAARDGRVADREDVIRAIDAIVDYYRRAEPGSPVPVLLLRARSWVKLDFLSILQDLSPNSVEETRKVLGVSSSEQN